MVIAERIFEKASMEAWGGLDVAQTYGLTCFAVLAPLDDGALALAPFFLLPGSNLHEAAAQDAGSRYAQWAEEGWIELTKGRIADHDRHAELIERARDHFESFVCGYNRRHGMDIVGRLERADITTHHVAGSYDGESGAVHELRRMIRSGALAHDGNPCMEMCLANMRTRRKDDAVRLAPGAQACGAKAAVRALAAMLAGDEPESDVSVYEDHKPIAGHL